MTTVEQQKTFDQIDDPTLRVLAVACFERKLLRDALTEIEGLIQRRGRASVGAIEMVVSRALTVVAE